MKQFLKHYFGISIALIVTLLVVSVALAQSAGGYEIAWWAFESGKSSSGNGYTLQGVIGQPEAGTASGGEYSLMDGFLSRFSIFDFRIFIPLITR